MHYISIKDAPSLLYWHLICSKAIRLSVCSKRKKAHNKQSRAADSSDRQNYHENKGISMLSLSTCKVKGPIPERLGGGKIDSWKHMQCDEGTLHKRLSPFPHSKIHFNIRTRISGKKPVIWKLPHFAFLFMSLLVPIRMKQWKWEFVQLHGGIILDTISFKYTSFNTLP